MKVVLLHSGQVGQAVKDFLAGDSLDLHSFSPEEWRDDRSIEWLRGFRPDWLILGWWPKIVGPEVLACCRRSLNIHNSFLPHCRGKHPNFWSLVEEAPYGVTLHEVTGKLDGGGIYARRGIPCGWEDTGETLHKEALRVAVELFLETWPKIRDGGVEPFPQEPGGSFHLAAELGGAGRVPVDDPVVRKALNLIRGGQAYGHSAWFEDGGERYSVTVDIRRVDGHAAPAIGNPNE